MKSIYSKICLVASLSLAIMFGAQSAEATSAIKITHAPASFAIKGQALTLRAKVTGGSGGVESVTLYYALFRDAAPFRVNMAPSGMDMYVGTIEAGLLSGLASISYYIEAQDRDGAIEETPWYDLSFKDPDAKGVTPPGRSPVPAPVAPSDPGRRGGGTGADDDEGMSGLTIGLIAGGAVALGAGAYFLADSGGSDGGGSGGGSNTNTNSVVGAKAGTYRGNVTTCRTLGANPATCETKSASIIIDSNGRVFSDTLVQGSSLSANLSGNDFVLTAPVSNSAEGWTGTIVFNGTVLSDNRIVGSISGAIDQAGTVGNHSGSFSLNK